ncbi:Uncharacterised protein [Mycobacteroides abscessus subsp. abscessus]|nr:Uncharacterised protein [Mycobacteroides abscessus subsp. abscessus]
MNAADRAGGAVRKARIRPRVGCSVSGNERATAPASHTSGRPRVNSVSPADHRYPAAPMPCSRKGPSNSRPATRSGASAAASMEIFAPTEVPPSTARSMLRASRAPMS